MATWSDVRGVAAGLPDAVERSPREWAVRRRPFVLERALRRSDVAHLGEGAPENPPMLAWVADLDTKEAMVRSEPGTFFTTPHFDGYPMVLVRLDALDVTELAEVVTDAWLCRAPVTLGRRWLAEHPSV